MLILMRDFIRLGMVLRRFEISVEYNIVVVLGHVSLEPVVFSQETDKLLRRSVIPKLFRFDSFLLQHFLEKCLSDAAPLYTLMHIEV